MNEYQVHIIRSIMIEWKSCLWYHNIIKPLKLLEFYLESASFELKEIINHCRINVSLYSKGKFARAFSEYLVSDSRDIENCLDLTKTSESISASQGLKICYFFIQITSLFQHALTSFIITSETNVTSFTTAFIIRTYNW